MFTRIDHVAIYANDLAESINFYKETFGFDVLLLQTLKSGHQIAYLNLGNTILEINEKRSNEQNGGHFCLHSDNFDADYQYLINKNLALVQAVHSTAARMPGEENWRRAVFLGLAGEHIEIRG